MADRQLSPPVREVLDELAAADAVTRLFDRDPTLWGSDPESQVLARNRLGWLDTAAPAPGWRDELERFAAGCHADGSTRVVLCGMGGSGFAPHVLAGVADPQGAGQRLVLLDSTHPAAVRAALGGGLDDALVIVSSKSGTTVETRAMGDYAAARAPSPAHLVAITDAGTPLDEAASAAGWRAVFRNPEDIGGRFSGLSLFGMVPAAAAGLPVEALWARAAGAARRCAPDVPAERNLAAVIAAFAVASARAGRDKLTLLLSEPLAPFGLWVEQLVAESTGKRGQGIVPVVGEPVVAPERYGSDRAFVEVRLAGRPVDGARALADAGLPLLTVDVGEGADVAGALYEWMVATALAGALMGINPFDQPDVGSAKEATGAVLAEIEASGTVPEPEDGDVDAVLAHVRPGDYLAVEAYLPPTAEVWQALRASQGALREVTGCAVTANVGPRYLHSTGQLHKGGPDGVVVVHVVDDEVGEQIPGRGYDFATLLRAQAVGDLRALRARGRRVTQLRGGLGALEALPGAARRAAAGPVSRGGDPPGSPP